MNGSRGMRRAALLLVPLLAAGCGDAPPAARTRPGDTASKAGEHAQANPAFQTLSFDQALAKAGGENKVVMVDFYTEWCGPCKVLDKTTWKDDNVVKWLGEKTVALKIDAEKQDSLAGKYKIVAYPTMLFVKPDGSELGRLVGYRKASEFLEEAADILAGKSPGDKE